MTCAGVHKNLSAALRTRLNGRIAIDSKPVMGKDMMGSIVRRMMFGASAVSLLLAAPVWAETRQALVIAERAQSQEIGQPARDALEVSCALLAAGFDVRRLESPSALPEAPVEAPDVMLIYLSADLGQQDGQRVALLSSGAIALEALAARYPARLARIVVAESCALAPQPLESEAIPAANLPAAPENALLVLSPGPGAACADAPRLTQVLLSTLKQPGTELSASLSDAGLPVASGAAWAGFQPIAETSVVATTGPLILDQPLRPVDPTAASPQPGLITAAGQANGGVQILPAAAPAPPLGGDRQARPLQSGLPEPSIIVGIRQRDEEAETEADPLLGTALGTSYEERRRIRDEDAALFASLLESGAFDPPSGQVAGAIQTELQRMNCYRGGIDGIWGNGSRGAVDRYFQQVNATPVTREAEIPLFRQIALRDDVRCPDPVAQPVARNPQPSTVRPVVNAQPARPQVTQPARPAPTAAPPAQQPALNPNAIGTGMFR